MLPHPYGHPTFPHAQFVRSHLPDNPLHGPVRTNVSYAANYDRAPHEVPQTFVNGSTLHIVHIVFTGASTLCHKPCQYQRANG